MQKEIIGKDVNVNTVVALGKFESLHKGHLALFSCAKKMGEELGASPVVYMIKDPASSDIISSFEKKSLAREFGIDAFYTDELSDEYKKIMPEEFVKNILKNSLSACHVVVGYNFAFGYKRMGTTEVLKELCKKYNIGVTVVDCVFADVDDNNIPISTSDIRRELGDGNVDVANKLLGRNFSLSGVVTNGKHLGRELGFPTANLVFEKKSVPLKKGVYATKTFVDGVASYSITNVGVNPTVDKEDGFVRVETHILNYDNDLYGRDIKVDFLFRIRDEKTFSSIDELKNQLNEDVKKLTSKI